MLYIFIITFLLVNVTIFFQLDKISKFINIYDKPDNKRKFHLKNIPILGGLIFFFNLLIFLIFLNIENFLYQNSFP